MQNDELSKIAIQWVKENKKKLFKQFCDPEIYLSSERPFTIFMAGTPGAGKTEFSQSLINELDEKIVRIDADEIRELMRPIGYDGSNSEVFQRAAVKAVNWLYDFALDNKHSQSVLLDGTFAYGNWRENVERSLHHGRRVEIYYLYQDPLVAWNFVNARKLNNGRVVPKNVFIESYQLSIENVKKAKQVFGDNIVIYFAANNYEKSVEKIEIDVKNIENLLPKLYTKDELENQLHD